jgi:hypothetical protein
MTILYCRKRSCQEWFVRRPRENSNRTVSTTQIKPVKKACLLFWTDKKGKTNHTYTAQNIIKVIVDN